MFRTDGRLRLALVAALAGAPAASAQEVIVCFSLHNDVANFDRRAASVEPRWAKIEQARENAEFVSSEFRERCPPEHFEDPSCLEIRQGATAAEEELYRLRLDYAYSPLGGADPVRQRLMRELLRHGCLYRDLGDGKVARLAPDMSGTDGPPIRARY